MANYSELLKNPKWQRKRLTIMNRDKWRCSLCWNKERTLHVHHLKYIKGKKPWEYPNDYLMTLCEDCHEHVEFEIHKSIK